MKRMFSTMLAATAIALSLFASQSVPRAQTRGEHWVGAWATAVVTRPQGPQAGGGFGAAAPAPQCFGQSPQVESGTTAPATTATTTATTTAAPTAGSPPNQPGGGPPQAGPGGGGRGQGGGGGRGPAPVPLNFNDQTLRQIVHTSLAGDRVRVVVTNAFGTSPLAVGAAHVALREKDAAIVARSDRPMTFGGSPTVNVPAGAIVVSDPIGLTVPAFADLAIDLYLPGDT